MNEQLPQLLEESIKLELNIAELYRVFSELFPEDSEFWRELSLEEDSHAALLKTGRTFFLSRGAFPHELLSSSLENLTEINSIIRTLLKDYADKPPSREAAFNTSLFLEQSAGEIDFQHAIGKPSQSEHLKILQKLNKDNKDHIQKIKAYMRSRNI